MLEAWGIGDLLRAFANVNLLYKARLMLMLDVGIVDQP